jgi:predicted helicase
MIGFELQIGPFSVAQLKIGQALVVHGAELDDDQMRLYVADTLDDPGREELHAAHMYRPLADSRQSANKVKREERVVVVMGNPPFRERARQDGGWVVAKDVRGRSYLDAFRGVGTGRFEYKLHNMNIYFWRWATWKVFEAGTDPKDREGVVALITTSAYLTGPGFAGMREYLRQFSSEGWIFDLSPEGHRASVGTRVFPGVQQPICIGLFVRRADSDRKVPAPI